MVQLDVPVADLAYYDAERGWVIEPIAYQVIVGRSSRDENALRTRFHVR